MDIIYHRRIQKDLRAALDFYENEGGSKLGDRFFADVEQTVARVIRNPQAFHYVTDSLRRTSLECFPYHFLFEENSQRVHFLVLRHDKRHSNFGLRRK